MSPWVALAVLMLGATAAFGGARAPLSDLDKVDVVWDSPSADAAGSMPIGNGEVVLNVWVEAKTGDLLFYIARSDALSEISRILKLGRIRVHLDPSPFVAAKDFRQHLQLKNGEIVVTGGGAKLRLLVDSASNAIYLAGSTGAPVKVTATVEDWRDSARELPKDEQGSAWSVHDAPMPLIESADQFISGRENEIEWFHRNETSVVPTLLALQSLTGAPGSFDPLLHRTFGALMQSPSLKPSGPRTLASDHLIHEFELRIATASKQSETVAQFRSQLRAVADFATFDAAEARTGKWWHDFWDRSWVFTSDPEVTRGYTLQRYVQACQGRGKYPIKFNGGYYTVEPTAMGKPFNADWRAWGDCQWYQNVRHTVHPMLASGDFDMMESFFQLYESNRALAESRTKIYHQVEGAYFPETMTVFGTYSGGDYGWNRAGLAPRDVQCPWWQFAWNQGPELVALMLDRNDYVKDDYFTRNRLVPMAEAVLKYFDTRFQRDAQGKLVLDPTQVVETYWSGVKNDMPSVSGLIAITDRLCKLPERFTTANQRAFFARMKKACPDLPIQTVAGATELAPAQKYDPQTSNVENGQLYAVWPFRLVSLSKPTLIDDAKRAYAHRLNHLDAGWGYDGNVAALLGMTEEADRILMLKCRNSHPAYRWPASWGPNFDWIPDQNHGGNLLNTTNLMLMQCDPMSDGGKIRILPAWPLGRDVDFRLHAPQETTVHCIAKGGKIVKLEVSPASRRKDVVLPAGWTLP